MATLNPEESMLFRSRFIDYEAFLAERAKCEAMLADMVGRGWLRIVGYGVNGPEYELTDDFPEP